ncbi:MAG TPA: ATP-dependent DNA ligase [Reyranella sp.]|nr:ATP-dependent DNA ligase [Reyranella sp.]
MEARSEAELPRGAGWQFEPKWDGFRCLARRADGKVDLLGRSGKNLSRYFPDVVANLSKLKARRFVLDGELVIPVDRALSFEALQMRLHPAASRVNKLAAEHPARLIAFDALEIGGRELRGETLAVRRRALEQFFGAVPAEAGLLLSPKTTRRATASAWLRRAGSGALDGVVAKRLDQPYLAGERAMIKVKCLRTADCVVGGFRFAGASRTVGSLLLGLYDEDGKLDHVGFVSSFPESARPDLKRRMMGLRGGTGFTGAAPGGPSRWSTERSGQWEPVKPRLVVEVQYDQVTGDRFRHGTRFVRWRPDKRPAECTFYQLHQEAAPSRLMADLERARK